MNPRTNQSAVGMLTIGIDHYENFPVASWLCPSNLRPAVIALYRFARTADDLADEGQLDTSERLERLSRFRQALCRCLLGQPIDAANWPEIFAPLSLAVERYDLPSAPLNDLIDAFEQDVRHTATGHVYADQDELLAYCQRSANPVGRLLLHLYGIGDEHTWHQSDAICSALQLINFWQDISEDLPRQRLYIPADALSRHGLGQADLATCLHGSAPADVQARACALVTGLCQQARQLMEQGAPLALRLPGRLGWELRLVVQGGLRILDKIAEIDYRSWRQRPNLGRTDLPLLFWRALTMSAMPKPMPKQ